MRCIREFARAVLAVEPSGTGAPVSILESGDAVVHAFLQAGTWALISITIILWITLGRLSDVLLTLVPLILAGVVTLEICVLIGLKLNFANIIALPLLLGVGVAFKIYYIMAWRAGQTNLLQSALTRAVFYSAMTTATAFGSLWSFEPSRHIEHGQADGAVARDDTCGGGAVPAGPHGPAARNQSRRVIETVIEAAETLVPSRGGGALPCVVGRA